MCAKRTKMKSPAEPNRTRMLLCSHRSANISVAGSAAWRFESRVGHVAPGRSSCQEFWLEPNCIGKQNASIRGRGEAGIEKKFLHRELLYQSMSSAPFKKQADVLSTQSPLVYRWCNYGFRNAFVWWMPHLRNGLLISSSRGLRSRCLQPESS